MLVDPARRPQNLPGERGDSHSLTGLHAQSPVREGHSQASEPPELSPPVSPASRNSDSGRMAESHPSRRSPKLQREGTI